MVSLALRKVGAILIGFWYGSFYIDYHILDKLFELCLSMQIGIPHESHVDSFLIPSPQKSSIFTSLLPFQNSSDIQGYSDIPIYFTSKNGVNEFSIRNASNDISHQVNRKRA